MSGYRPPYTIDEQRKIVRYIIDNKLFGSVRGNECWKRMEADGVVNRTWQSAKEHFRKQIVYMLKDPRLALTEHEIECIASGFNNTAMPIQPKVLPISAPKPADLTNIICDSSDDEI